MAKLSAETTTQILESFARTGNKTRTAAEVGVNRCTVVKVLSEEGNSKQVAAEIADRNRELHIERELLRDVRGEKSFRSFLEQVVRESVTPMPRTPATRSSRGTGSHELAFMLSLNDWHFEETVKSEAVLGLNEYSVEVACRRVWRVVDACRHWHRDVEAGKRFRVRELTVALNGDMVTGTLHGLEKKSDAPNIVRATIACGDLIALAIRDLAKSFESVRVVGTVGNHGRLPDDKRVPTKDPTRSFDYLAYAVAQRRLGQCENVTWELPEAYGVLYDVLGHTFYQAHGNFVPQQLGIVGYGLRRFTSALAANLSAAGKPLKYAVFGHWHAKAEQEFAGVTAFISPSLIGTQEYSFLGSGAVNRPAQLLLIVDRELGYVGSQMFYGVGSGPEGTYEVDL